MTTSRFGAPRRVREGSTLAIVAPSSPFPLDDFETGLAKLRTRYTLHVRDDVTERTGYLAGDDARRAEELLEALRDPAVDAIVSARGGYGATRIVDRIDVELVRRERKLLVGFSDVTALHGLWARAGVRSVHGPMVAWLGKQPDAEIGAFIDALEGRGGRAVSGLLPVTRGRAEGPLLGGNLAVLASLIGTQAMPDLRGAVLFLEDIGEKPFRLDRMLTQLRASGALDGIAGVAVGQLTQCVPNTDGVTAEAVIDERLGALGVPMVRGIQAGHEERNDALVFGATVELDADAGTLRFLDGLYDD